MGIIQIALVNEHGTIIEEVEGRVHLLGQYLPPMNDQTSQCLRFVDSYGDTIFNHLQMDPFIVEWQQISDQGKTDEERKLLHRVLELAMRCKDEPHKYLKFYGD